MTTRIKPHQFFAQGYWSKKLMNAWRGDYCNLALIVLFQVLNEVFIIILCNSTVLEITKKGSFSHYNVCQIRLHSGL